MSSKDSDINKLDENGTSIFDEIRKLNAKVDSLQKSVDSLQRSQCLLFQLLPNKIREGIVDGLNERNRNSYR